MFSPEELMTPRNPDIEIRTAALCSASGACDDISCVRQETEVQCMVLAGWQVKEGLTME